MKKTSLFLCLLFMSLSGFAKTWVITNSGFEFSPDDISIQLGDSVMFQLDGIHNAIEVSQSTWNSNGNSPGVGFAVPLGGGLVPAALLAEGTHYFVCGPHASLGMKGKINVENTTAVDHPSSLGSMSIYPNPGNGTFYFSRNDRNQESVLEARVFTMQGAFLTSIALGPADNKMQLNLSPGAYVIRITGKEGTSSEVILIQ